MCHEQIEVQLPKSQPMISQTHSLFEDAAKAMQEHENSEGHENVLHKLGNFPPSFLQTFSFCASEG